jgi:ProP effector
MSDHLPQPGDIPTDAPVQAPETPAAALAAEALPTPGPGDEGPAAAEPPAVQTPAVEAADASAVPEAPGAPAANDGTSGPAASEATSPHGEGGTTAGGDSEPTPVADAAPPAAPRVPELSPAACAARLAELFPALFGTAPQPVKLRIQADIQQRAPGLFTRRTLSAFLHRHTTSTAYLKALVHAPQRVDLDGAPAGEIAPEHKAAATEELARRRAIVDARRAAEIQARREAGNKGRQERQAAERGRRPAQAGPGSPPASGQPAAAEGGAEAAPGPRADAPADTRTDTRPMHAPKDGARAAATAGPARDPRVDRTRGPPGPSAVLTGPATRVPSAAPAPALTAGPPHPRPAARRMPRLRPAPIRGRRARPKIPRGANAPTCCGPTTAARSHAPTSARSSASASRTSRPSSHWRARKPRSARS